MKIATILAAKGDTVATITPGSTVTELLARLDEHNVGALVVIDDDGQVKGVVGERDVVRALRRVGVAALDAPISGVMSDLVAVCAPESKVEDIAIAMTNKRVRHVPVLDDHGQLAGIVSIGDVVKARIDELEQDRNQLIHYITT